MRHLLCGMATMNKASIEYKHKLVTRLLFVMEDLQAIDKELALSIPVQDIEELGKLLVPVQEKIFEIRRKYSQLNQRFEYKKRKRHGY
jgi:hypothetical protein